MTTESLWSDGKCPQPTKSQDKDTDREREKTERCRERDREKDRLEKAAASQKWAKPINELDLSNCEQCTPSYRLLPKNVCVYSSLSPLVFVLAPLVDICFLAVSNPHCKPKDGDW